MVPNPVSDNLSDHQSSGGRVDEFASCFRDLHGREEKFRVALRAKTTLISLRMIRFAVSHSKALPREDPLITQISPLM